MRERDTWRVALVNKCDWRNGGTWFQLFGTGPHKQHWYQETADEVLASMHKQLRTPSTRAI